MPTVIELAAKGHKKSMTALYEANKAAVYGLCRILLGDKQRSAGISVNVFSEAWDKIAEKDTVTEEEFRHMLLIAAANRCRIQLFPKDIKAIKLPQGTVQPYVDCKQEPYTGPSETGLKKLQLALEQVDALSRFVYLAVTAAGLDYKEAGRIIRQRDYVARQCVGAAEAQLPQVLETAAGGPLAATQVRSLLQQALQNESVPQSVDEACLSTIRERAKQNSAKSLKAVAWAGGAVAMVVLCVVLLVTFLKPGPSCYADIKIRDYGTITVKLDREAAPITVDNFVSLAESGFYEGVGFHRIIEGFMMQGGDPDGDGIGGSEKNIVGEFALNGYDNPLSHTRGAISMARTGNDYNSASSQFFIVHQDNTLSLDGKYACFGYVTEGMEVVDAICESAEPIDGNGKIAADARPIIESVTIRTE